MNCDPIDDVSTFEWENSAVDGRYCTENAKSQAKDIEFILSTAALAGIFFGLFGKIRALEKSEGESSHSSSDSNSNQRKSP
jgi:hypothetical protein